MNLDWKQLLKFNQDEVLGLDIGSSSVKLIQLRKKEDGGYTVTAAGIADIADETESEQTSKEINTVKAIRNCVESASVRTRLAVCGVCGPEVAVRYFKFPSLSTEEMQGAVMLEAAQVCPFNVDDGVVEYRLIPSDKDNISGFLVAATNKVIKNKSRLTEKASLNNVLMDVDGLALLNCFEALPFYEEAHSPKSTKGKPEKSQNGLDDEYEEPEASRATAILNVGSSHTTVAIMSDNNLPFIRDMAYAGNDIVEQIASECDVPAKTVSSALTGREDSSQLQLELGDSLAKACQKLITDVTDTLRYYTAQEAKSTIVEKVFVCGGFALAKGFIELLDSRLPAKAVLWNPFDNVRCDAEQHHRDILQKNGPAMAVAAGLAMRSI